MAKEGTAELVEDHVEQVKAKAETNGKLSIEVEIPNGNGEKVTRTVCFTSLNEAPLGIVRTTRNNQNEQMWRILEWALAPKDLEILDQVPSRKLTELLQQMQDASNITLGES